MNKNILIILLSLTACASEFQEDAPSVGAAGGPAHVVEQTRQVVIGGVTQALGGCHFANNTNLPIGANLAPEFQALMGWVSQFETSRFSCQAFGPVSMRCTRTDLGASYSAVRQAPNTAPVAVKMTCSGSCTTPKFANWNGVSDTRKSSDISYSNNANTTETTHGFARFTGNKNDVGGGFYFCRVFP